MLRRSDDLDEVGGHPDVELLEPSLELFFVSDEELAVIWSIGNIENNAHEVIAVHFTLMLPEAANHLRLGGDGSEVLAEFQQRLTDEAIGDGLAIVKPQGQKDLEPPERTAHRWPAPGLRKEFPPEQGKPMQERVRA